MIMYIYHALINALSAHMIYIHLNTIFYTQYSQHTRELISARKTSHEHISKDLIRLR